MSSSDSHPVRAGVIATVVGGLVLAALGELWPPAKIAWIWLSSKADLMFGIFTDSYSVKGWLLSLVVVLASASILRFVARLRTPEPPDFSSYVDDNLFGARWRWSWHGQTIGNLWCYCPRCDAELVYDYCSGNSLYAPSEPKTDFYCEHCRNEKVASIGGGNKTYALSAVQREIRRKIRTNEYPTGSQSA